MRNGTPGFIGARLVQAREARCITARKGLADMLGRVPSTISRWEEGAASPEPAALSELARVLRVREEFFTTPGPDLSTAPVFYRSTSATLKRDRAMQRARLAWLVEIAEIVDHYAHLPEVDLPEAISAEDYASLRDEDLEDIAAELRRRWNLGDGPVLDMVEQLQRVGFVIGSQEMATDRLDGLFVWSDTINRPVILLATDKASYARRQFDAAHEMAHAVLHRALSPEIVRRDHNRIEQQAHRLASAFLLPSTSYPLEVRAPTIAQLEQLKRRWRVSIKAQIVRLAGLQVLDDWMKTRLFKIYSAKGYARGEPGDDLWPLQEPRLFREALQVIVDDGVRTRDDLRHVDFLFSEEDVAELAHLPGSWFSAPPPQIVELRPIPNSVRRNGKGGGGGQVLSLQEIKGRRQPS